ncbi:hypothetical protein AAC387_Pa07g0400 [Persea americana]
MYHRQYSIGWIQQRISTEESQVQSGYSMDFINVFTTEEIFHSRDALVNWARDVGKRNGSVIVIKVSNAARPGIKARVVLVCERSGHYKHCKTIDEGPTKKKIEQTGSKKCGCPFTLKGKKLDTSDDWMLEVACGVYNHSVAEYL